MATRACQIVKVAGIILSQLVTLSTQFDFRYSASKGMFPPIFNLAAHAEVTANSTCGEFTTEVYCTLTEDKSTPRCGVCDSKDPDKAHPASLAIDGTDRWWQSPSLQFGPAYHTVSLTINLKQVYQVDYIIITAGVSPRPANWVLERSLDGVRWEVWQYHAATDEECWLVYGMEPRKGKPTYKDDTEVICTSYYSSLKPLEAGEISISLINGRPGAQGPSKSLLEFTKSRFIRLSFQKLQTLPMDQIILGDSSHPEHASIARRYFYSVRDISIGGQCPCHGHASECPTSKNGGYQCQCRHNTCGPLCNTCCPMFNQKRWRPGKYISGNECERCQCFGHADECYFDPLVEAERRSLNTAGKYSGGGVCINCKDKTTGVNCEQCISGYFRPSGVSRFDKNPCVPCSCDTPGSERMDKCYQDSNLAHQGHEAGDCVCKAGFAGPRCDQCAVGYTNYPRCVPCPCSPAGTMAGQCTGDCQCKQHATGSRCDRCKPGYFALQAANPDGCTECFCYGVSSSCESANYGVEVIDHESGWQVTDIAGNVRVNPYWSSVTSGLTIAQEDIGLDAYYWEAPEQYIGNKLISYGQSLTVHTSWHTGRGDTSGTPTREPDIVLEGGGYKIGYGSSNYRGGKNATIQIVFLEHDWYHLSDNSLVTKHEFMQCMGSLDRLLIRAKYHSDQLEGTLHTAAMEFGMEGSHSLTRTKAVEICTCPPGYSGLSCERCSYGYTRLNNTIYRGECKKCSCYGHSPTCDPFTLKCADCEHNTVGENCEKCAPGFYGNAKLGRPNDCKPCKCPLDIPSNNFSPTCQVATIDYDKYSLAPEEYICDACPPGYEGAHCERCANGYFGNPLNIGDFCKPCRCSGNADQSAGRICDHITGECTACLGNTGGWHCDICLPGFYGNPGDGFCKPCNCNPYGSIDSQCNPRTGECRCKEKYVGRTCGQCRDGFGNVKAGCRQCGCNKIGSDGDSCDADTGKCNCKPGVTGFLCDKCLPLHYGFSDSGCKSCGCHREGSVSEECHPTNGDCTCKPRVTGKQCNRCQKDHWGIKSGSGCVKCECDMFGSVDNNCDDVTGQCKCKPGVGGLRCDSCEVGFWGMSRSGCVKCSPCQKKGHVCDPDTGRCVCPPLTEGPECENCIAGGWNYNPYRGCQRCQCHPEGSLYGQCDSLSGKCRCLEGFEGDRCERCAPGYYNFPKCRKCNCNPIGTQETACRSGVCQCDENGVCPCKSRVAGKKCASCSPGYFGLSALNPEGCTECFCFGRTRECSQAPYSWTQMVMPRKRQLVISRGDTRLPSEGKLLMIPGTQDDPVIGVGQLFDVPLYWRLPTMFEGDRVLSYNGYLRFNVQTNGESIFSQDIMDTFPLVHLLGNHNIRLLHFPAKFSGSGRYEVRLHEDEWINEKNPDVPVTRTMLMICLQGIQQILIRATESYDATIAFLHGVSLDVARPAPTGSPRPATGIEMCSCPPKYNSTSCQDPGRGFYRYFKKGYVESEIIIDLVGDSMQCMCNGRADHCEPDTGYCLGCRENTAGAWCDICASGYYGNPLDGVTCQPCQCPSTSKNFALTCSINSLGNFNCQCQEGYTGPKCERCAYGYYGNPEEEGGQCLSCNCNMYGSETDQCDIRTGQCYCVAGVSGRDCGQCEPRHILTQERVCKNCNDGCVGALLDTMEEIKMILIVAKIEDLDPAPMRKLTRLQDRTEVLEKAIAKLGQQQVNISLLLTQENILRPKAELSVLEAARLEQLLGEQDKLAGELSKRAETVNHDINQLGKEIRDLIAYMDNHGKERSSAVSLAAALENAASILAEIESRQFAEADIRARTEMSEARILYEKVQELLYGKVEGFPAVAQQLDKVDRLVNDLLQYMQQGISIANEATKWNMANGEQLERSSHTCAKVTKLGDNSKRNLKYAGSQLVDKAKDLVQKAGQLFSQLEVLLRKLNRNGGLLEVREIGLSGVVEDYRTRFVLPCQANAERLYTIAQRLEGMFNNKIGISADNALQAAQAYQRIKAAMAEARRTADAALEAATEAERVTDAAGGSGGDWTLLRRADRSRTRSEDLRQEAQGLWKNADDMTVQVNGMEIKMEKYEFDLEQKSQLLASTREEIARQSHVSNYIVEVSKAGNSALTEADNVHTRADNLLDRVRADLRFRANELNSFSPDELGAIPRKISESLKILQTVEKQAAYMERRTQDLAYLNEQVSTGINVLRQRVQMARHAASNIHISVTGNDLEPEPGIATHNCGRSYDVQLKSTSHNEISLVYGIDSDHRDSMLLYLPAREYNLPVGFYPNVQEMNNTRSSSNDFMALEMVDRKIRLVWNLGGGVQAITHNVEIETAFRLDRQDEKWYRITAERIGHIGRLNVQKVRPKFDTPAFHKWVVGETPATANVLDIDAAASGSQSRVWLGGLPSYALNADAARHLQSGGEFHGVMYQLHVDKRRFGLWNFEENLSCRATYPGVSEVASQQSCHSFSGDGYAVQEQIRNYHPRYYAISLEFRSFDLNALLVLVASQDENRQYLSLDLIDGRVRFRINYGGNTTMEFQSKNTYNSGQWVKIEAGRAYRGGVETGVLRLTYHGLREDFVDTLPAIRARRLNLANSRLYFGGVPPDFPYQDFPGLPAFSLLGNMRGITTSNPGSNSQLNPLYTKQNRILPHFGVTDSCEHKILKKVSFRGRGHVEVRSHTLREESSFGFSFLSRGENGLLLISSYLGQPSGDLSDYYSLALQGGNLAVKFGHAKNPDFIFVTNNTVADGKYHTVFLRRNSKKVTVYVDDQRVNQDDIVLNTAAPIKAPENGGLFIGGIPSIISEDVRNLKMAASTQNLVGTIKDVTFMDAASVRLVAMNEPVSFFNAAIGREL